MSHLFVLTLDYLVDLAEVDRHLEAHRDYLTRNYAGGTFLASGRKEPRTGGVIIARGDDRAAIDRVVADDPFHRHGIAHYSITEFVPTMTADMLREVRETN